ncbi:toxin-antitoxin system YwqK family antitoxin [Cochleicola gelatinilyticus]|nr:hypothetical protein [Cochleicola gelatinilyticus]
MKKTVLILILVSLASCNYLEDLADEMKGFQKQTIDKNDYKYVIDKKNRRGYVTIDNKIMDGIYIVLQDSVLYEELHIKDGFLHGPYYYFNSEGNITLEATYYHSYRDGFEKIYYKNGTIRSEKEFKRGKPTGTEYRYDETGTLVQKEIVEDGITYKHQYYQGKHTGTEYLKTIQGESFLIFLKYDNLGNIKLILGKQEPVNSSEFYVFAPNFDVIEVVNPNLDPETAQYYFSMLQDF